MRARLRGKPADLVADEDTTRAHQYNRNIGRVVNNFIAGFSPLEVITVDATNKSETIAECAIKRLEMMALPEVIASSRLNGARHWSVGASNCSIR